MIPPFTTSNTSAVLHTLTTHNPLTLVLAGLSIATFFVMLGVAITTSRFAAGKLGSPAKVVSFPISPAETQKANRG